MSGTSNALVDVLVSARAAIDGSVVRGEVTAASDADLDPGKRVGIGIALGLSLGPPARAGLRSERRTIQQSEAGRLDGT